MDLKREIFNEYATELREIYLSLLRAGFTTEEAFELTKAQVNSSGIVYLQNALDNARTKKLSEVRSIYFNKPYQKEGDE